MKGRSAQLCTVLFLIGTILLSPSCSIPNDQDSDTAPETKSIVQEETDTKETEDGIEPSSDTHGALEYAQEGIESAQKAIEDELASRRDSVPIHAPVGEEVLVTDNLGIKIVSVSAGPFDYADQTDTVKVVVEMRNLSDAVIHVKPSNFNADTVDGKRVSHKLYIKSEGGSRDVRSFSPTAISPQATFTGEVYFDGSGLTAVVYEPHWLVSSQNQYVYFDIAPA